MFDTALVQVTFRTDGPDEIQNAARWMTEEAKRRIGVFEGPDPHQFRDMVAGAHNGTAERIKESYAAAVGACPEWELVQELKVEAAKRFNGGRWLPIITSLDRAPEVD